MTKDPSRFEVGVTAQGIGGMGITVKTSSSWSGYMTLLVIGRDGSIPLNDVKIPSNGETHFNDLLHYSTTGYAFQFTGIPEGRSVFVQIWIYG